MPKFKIVEFRTTPYTYVVEAKNATEAEEIYLEEGVLIGTDDDFDVYVESSETELLKRSEKIPVKYQVEK